MPNHKSAIKRAKQNEKRRLRKRKVMSNMRTLLKKARVAVESGDPQANSEALPLAVRALNRAADKGAIHRNTASRKIGRLMKAAHQASKAEG